MDMPATLMPVAEGARRIPFSFHLKDFELRGDCVSPSPRGVGIGRNRQKIKKIRMKRFLYKAMLASTFLLASLICFLAPEALGFTHIEDVVRENIQITGRITDGEGVALPGVTVYVKDNKSIGTSTDVNGRYIIEVPDEATLVFSMIGFDQQEVNVAGKREINITLKISSTQLDEAVIVGFGKQKKKEVVGSVTSINVNDLKVPTSNLTTALAGRAAGLIAFQRSGEPGADNANFFVRGVTTFGYKKDPLILIDGVELTTEDLVRLRPDDIENFTILKDATATAVYGARAANGVILVTTKSGQQGPARISVRIENSFSSPTRNVKLADPVTYMKLANEAVLTRNPLKQLPYLDEKIANTAAGNDPLVFPQNDWYHMLFKNYSTSQRGNLNVSGGGHVARYYVSGSFTHDNGILKVDKRNNFNNNIDLMRYSLRANVDVSLTKSTKLSVKTSGNFDDYNGPIGSGTTSGGTLMYQDVMHANPVLFAPYYPADSAHQYVNHILFGNAGDEGGYLNPYAEMVRGYKDESRSFLSVQAAVDQNLDFWIKGLSVRSMVNINRTANFSITRSYEPFWYSMGGYDDLSKTYSLTELNPTGGTEYLNYKPGSRDQISSFYWETRANYTHSFEDKSNVSAMLVGILRSSITPDGSTLEQSLPSRNTGLSGRATYNYAEKYYAEFDFGYNGSERFYKSSRFGFFPSFGLAWTLSNEGFFSGLKDKITNLKLRATYGIVGNDAVGGKSDRFFYLSETNPNDNGRGGTFGKDNLYSRPGYSINRYPNPDITWERSYQSNFGIDLSLFDKLDFTGEYYRTRRKDILMTRVVPTTMGLNASTKANIGEATSSGVDLSLNYNQSFYNGLWLKSMANFTYAVGKFQVYEEPEYQPSERYRSHVGQPINQRWGYIAERLFVDDAEAANSPKQNFGLYGGGDIKYQDVNSDGQITEADMVPIGYPTNPEIVYGFGLSAGYKSFDLSLFFQGLARESFWMNTDRYSSKNTGSTVPFDQQGALLEAYAKSHWSEENQDVYAIWPRLSSTINDNNTQTSTWFMRNGAFLRLKQVELGYTLPKTVQRVLHTTALRFYLNATNLFTFSHFNMWDVEMGGDGLGYPIQRVVNVGLNISFN